MDLIEKLLRDEAAGDSSNFKGTDYHLLYALWLLLRQGATSVSFFAGNDLSVTQVAVASPRDEASTSADVCAESSEHVDEWIQLKSSADDWTVGELLKGNVLRNFVFNSIVSESRGRDWHASLVTPGRIRTQQLLEFIEDPPGHPGHLKAINGIIDSIQADAGLNDRSFVARRAFEVLSAIAKKRPVHREVLLAELMQELLVRFGGDSSLAQSAMVAAYGAMLRDASSVPPVVRTYDLAWLSGECGIDLNERSLFNLSAAEACDEQVAEAILQECPQALGETCVGRTRAIESLDQFLRSDETLFVLTGASGVGKSWTVSRWAAHTLIGRMRVFVSRPGLSSLSLQSLVADALAPFASSHTSDRDLLRRFCQLSRTKAGPGVVVVDDLRPDAGQRDVADKIDELVRAARRHGIKLVITCQSDIARNLRPFRRVDSASIFSVGGRGSRRGAVTLVVHEPASQDNPEVSAQSDPGKGEVKGDDELLGLSLHGFSDSEFEQALRRRLGEKVDSDLLTKLRDPAYVDLRHPYTLDAVCSVAESMDVALTDTVARSGLPALLDLRIDTALTATARAVGAPLSDVREALHALVGILFEHRLSGIKRKAVTQLLDERSDLDSTTVVEGFAQAGLLRLDGVVRVPDVRLSAALFARYLHSLGRTPAEINSLLSPAVDSETVSALVVSSDDPVAFATEIVDSNVEWLVAAAEGLVGCNPADPRCGALLLAFARSQEQGWNATDAYGRFGLRSEPTWRDLVRRFVSRNNDDRRLADRSMWAIARFAPREVVHAVRLRFYLSLNLLADARSSLKQDVWKRERKRLAEGLRVLENIDGPEAAGRVLSMLGQYEQLAADPYTTEEAVFVLNDQLLHAFDQVRTIAASFAAPEIFARFLADLESSDHCARARAVHALESASQLGRRDVGEVLVKRLGSETEPILLSRLLWSSYGVAQQDPDAVLSSLERDSARFWSVYDTSAAMLSLLETMVDKRPARVLAIIPAEFPQLSIQARALLSELIAAVQIRGGNPVPLAEDWVATKPDEHGADKLEKSLEFHRLRGRSAERLLRAATQSRIVQLPQVYRMEFRDYGIDFFRFGFGSWLEDNDLGQLDPQLLSESLDLLIATTQSEASYEPNLLDHWALEVRFAIQRDCLDAAVVIASFLKCEQQLLSRIPSDWEAMYAINKLLERGRTDAWLIDSAVAACEGKKKSRTGQAGGEMSRCLVHLNRIAPHRAADLREPRVPWFFLAADDRLDILAARFDADRADPIASLESSFRDGGKLVDVASWNSLARRWPSVFLSEAFSRMCALRSLTTADAMRLAEQLVAALKGMPGSESAVEHRRTYIAILAAMNGQIVDLPTLREEDGPIGDSHALAMRILREGIRTPEEIRKMFLDRRGWEEDWNHRWETDGTIQPGSGMKHYVAAFFPAVRLALFAAGAKCGWADPGYSWMVERHRSVLEVQESGFRHLSKERLGREIERFRGLAQESPDQDVLHSRLGTLLLLAGELTAARTALVTALDSPVSRGRTRGHTLYNLACVEARLGNEDACRAALAEGLKLYSQPRSQVEKDTDFESVMNTDWFVKLCESLKR